MKRHLFTIALVLTFVFANAQVIDNLLVVEMNRHSDNEQIEVVVMMNEHYDRTILNRKANSFTSRAERRDFVVKELKAFAEVSQKDIMATLEVMEQQGLVSSVRSLWSANALFFSANAQAIAELSERHDIERISFNKQYQCIIPEAEVNAGAKAPNYDYIAPNIRQVNADQVWETGNMGQGVVVAVLDTGVNYNHDDLIDHLWDGGEEFPNHGYDVYNIDDDPMDDNGHGTHCAGIVCGDGTAWLATGIAPEATLMCVKTTSDAGASGAAMIAKGMEWALEHGCDLISLSQGIAKAEIADKELLRYACDAYLDAGIVAVVAAGNEGTPTFQNICPIPNNVRVPGGCPPPYLDPDQMENPGGLSCVMSVGAVDENDTIASFTSHGPVTWQDTEYGDYSWEPGIGLIRPDVCAPGVMIWSLKYNNIHDYDYRSGTSQATPCVAGIVALMLCENPNLMSADICRILEETALKLTPRKSNITGCGRVDALAAVQASFDDGVDEYDDASITVYPNPATDIVSIVRTHCVRPDENANIELLDIHGQIMEIRVQNNKIDVSNLPNGIYFIKKGEKTSKLVIER